MARPLRSRVSLQIIVGVVILAVAGAVVFAVAQGTRRTSAPTAGATHTAAPAGIATAVGSVPASVFDTVGIGTAKVAPAKIDAPGLTDGGKPQVVYVGGEFCPFCAAERWPLAVALARFGTFDALGETSSAPAPEVYPGTATLSFHGATFTSDYLSLAAREIYDRDHKPLDKLTDAEQQVLSTYDAPPYTQTSGSIPFIDFGGGRVIAGAQYTPDVLAGKTQAQIAAALSQPGSPIAQAVIGAANVLTVGLCEQTAGQPASVCRSKGVQTAAAAMGAG
ncbi:DUF929 family protein [Gryllotalpicola protaetiae]|uniref:DUF929 family protein n=1 Tax=Gryllotalpicola protaetiae TaxID=2419771 RepID=UPI0013C49670|nr:DUF929 family protein [Gryllotalpicola protaetiae]